MAMDRKTTLLLVPLIMAIIAIIALIGAIVWMEGDYDKFRVEISKLTRERDNRTRERGEAEYTRQNLSRFVDGREDVDDQGIDLLRRRFLQGGPEDVELRNYKLESTTNRQKFEKLTDVYKQIFQERLICLKETEKAILAADAARKDLEKAQEGFVLAKGQLEEEKRVLSEDKSKIEKDFERFKQEASVIQADISRKLKELSDAKDEEHKKSEMDIAALHSQISEYKRALDEKTKKKPLDLMSCDPDGEIIDADNKLGIAWIDLGRQHHVRAGMVFDIFRYIKGGRRKIKGQVEIRAVQDNMSQVSIIECKEPEDDPIVKGDYIISPLYDKKETPIFVFSGELVNPLYSRTEVGKKIEEAGGKVAPEVTVETDFLIAGRGAEGTEAYAKAIDLRVVIMRENELFRYIGR